MNYQFDEPRMVFDDLQNTALGISTAAPSSRTFRDTELEKLQQAGHHINLHPAQLPGQLSRPSALLSRNSYQDVLVNPLHFSLADRHGVSYPQSDPSRSPHYAPFDISPAMNSNSLLYSGIDRLGSQNANYLMTSPDFIYAPEIKETPSRKSSYSLSHIGLEEEDGSNDDDDDDDDGVDGGEAFPGSSTESLASYLRSPMNVKCLASPARDTIKVSNNTNSTNIGLLHGRKKRNKCSPEQYRQLEAFFALNRNPTGKIREELSKRIQMPERSVQVWFQNKRAKTKNNEIKDGVPLEERTTVSRSKVPRIASDDLQGRKRKSTNEVLSQQEETVVPLPCSSLCIGEWRRIKPLICLFSRRNQSFMWYLSSESVGFKLECPRSCFKKITFSGPTEPTIHELTEGVTGPLGHITLELERPPQFYMEVFKSSSKLSDHDNSVSQKASWRQCTDFTEGKQATSTLQHVVSGPYSLLRQAVMQLCQSNDGLSGIIEFQDQEFSELQSQQRGVPQWAIPSAQYPLDETIAANNLMTSPTQELLLTSLDVQAATTAYQQGFASSDQSSWSSSEYPSSAAQASFFDNMPSSSALNMAALRIETAGLLPSNFDQLQLQQQQQQQQHHNLLQTRGTGGHEFHSFNWLDQQPLTSSTSWSISSESHLNNTAASSSISSLSAPPYEVRGFEQQQQQYCPPTFRFRLDEGEYRSPTPTCDLYPHNESDGYKVHF
ncbi:hypothetical protein CBS101457_006311 [Exobasidium rhododendri]|nr:hypothetical protein CBS101457_006311 [Exobasidium rhododendri]